MKGFNRPNQLFSLCGLNCGLCPMFLNKNCPGCGGGEGNQSCKIAKCSMEHDGAFVAGLLQDTAATKNIDLKLRKKKR